MIFNGTDLRYLKWGLLAFAASLSSAGGAIWLSNEYLAGSIMQEQEAQRQVDIARKDSGVAQDDLNNISIYASEYASLLERKIIAGEQRLDWMEDVDKQRLRHHLGNLKYTLAPQQDYAQNLSLNAENLNVRLSGIRLETDLLHEMQLMDFFAALRSERNGHFIVNHCELERAGTNGETTADGGTQLKANCTGGWITMQHGGMQ